MTPCPMDFVDVSAEHHVRCHSNWEERSTPDRVALAPALFYTDNLKTGGGKLTYLRQPVRLTILRLQTRRRKIVSKPTLCASANGQVLEKSRIKTIADVKRVSREIKILKRVRHPNVIALYEVMDTPSTIYFMMEHCDG